MVIKNLSWRKFAPYQLIQYINHTDKVYDTQPIYWNVSEYNDKGVIKDFEHQDSIRKLRKNSTRLIHDIISFSPEDSKYLNETIVRDLAFEYLKLRAEKQVCYGQIHGDKGHWHVHFALSPNNIENPKTVHINRKKYFEIRHDLELYQQKKYPQLSQSIVFLHSKNKEKTVSKKEAIVQLEKRTGTLSKVSEIQTYVARCFEAARSLEEFIDQLLQCDYEPYYYRDKINGIKAGGKKYRFSRLNISREQLVSLNSIENQTIKKRLQELEQLQNQPSKSKGLWR